MPFHDLVPEALPKKRKEPSFLIRNSLVDSRCNLFIEEYFHEMLALESKRSERSQRIFLLMLIDVSNITNDYDGKKQLLKITSILDKFTRDTDIKGWYRADSIIGVIFTELRELSQDYVTKKIYNKIYKQLSALLDLDQLCKVEISFRYFPDKPRKNLLHSTPELKLLSEQEESGIADQDALPSIERTPAHISGEQEKPAELSGAEISHASTKYRWLLLAGDLILISCATSLSPLIRFGRLWDLGTATAGAYVLCVMLYFAALYIFDMYTMGRSFHSLETVQRVAFSALLGGLICTVAFYVVPQWRFGRGILLIQMFTIFILITTWRIIFGIFFQVTMTKIGALILGTGQRGKAMERLLKSPLSPYEVKGFLDDSPSNNGKSVDPSAILGSIDQLDKITGQVWVKTAILATSRDTCRSLIRKILDVRLQGLEVVEMATVYERLTGRVPVKHIEDEWLLYTDGFYLLSKQYVQKIKRLFDILLAGLLIVCFSPVMLITALLIRLDSPGPIFYRQNRVGKYGRIFTVTKFRSMSRDAEAQGAIWAAKRDPRVTRVGRWIRLFRIDEVPQLFNVFKGEMSLVGPRPERPEFVNELETIIPYYAVRHSVTPGLTGWAQVNYPYGASVDDALHKLEYDLYYLKNMSPLLDWKILLKTIGVVLIGDGAR